MANARFGDGFSGRWRMACRDLRGWWGNWCEDMVQELASEMVKLSRMVDAAILLVRGKRRESQELHKSIGKACESHELHKCKHHLLSFCQTTSLFSRQTRREGTGRRQDGQRVDQDPVAPCACENTNTADAHAPSNGACSQDICVCFPFSLCLNTSTLDTGCGPSSSSPPRPAVGGAEQQNLSP